MIVSLTLSLVMLTSPNSTYYSVRTRTMTRVKAAKRTRDKYIGTV